MDPALSTKSIRIISIFHASNTSDAFRYKNLSTKHLCNNSCRKNKTKNNGKEEMHNIPTRIITIFKLAPRVQI